MDNQETMEKIIGDFSTVVLTQVERVRGDFNKQGIPCGGTMIFEIGAFNIFFMVEAFDRAEAPNPLLRYVVDQCREWLLSPFYQSYDPDDVRRLLHRRIGAYYQQLKHEELKQEGHDWIPIFSVLADKLYLYIRCHPDQDHLEFGEPTGFDETGFTKENYIWTHHRKQCLAATSLDLTLLWYHVILEWAKSGDFVILTPEELDALIDIAADKYSALMKFLQTPDPRFAEESDQQPNATH